MAKAELPVIIGIAASAGGLEATTSLVKNLPAKANASYVVAQHMSPTHKSLLWSLIGRETELPVIELKNEDLTPQPDTIYIAPPNFDVIMDNGKIGLREPSGHPGTPKPLADRLFKSLADECGERCVGIVLSGTGSDGSYGIRAIREAGGVTIAQEAGTAKYEGMPSSAIHTGCIDLTMSPDMIGQQLTGILASPRDFAELKSFTGNPSKLLDLYHILLARTGVDFREYKETTINRRIARRMVAQDIDVYDDYVEFCRETPSEVDALYKDMMISVTRFFRDQSQFNQLTKVIQTMVEENQDRQLRVWVAGSATGEEAYSLAILFAEAMGGLEAIRKERIQIFATDIDTQALEVARRGVYPLSAANDVPRHYVDDYLHISGDTLEVDKHLRAVVLFSRHNIIQDPPFINMDMISLRNLLIYFGSSLQEKVLSRMAYALVPNGKLFLGSSETVGAMHGHFETQSLPDKIYSKRGLRQSVQATANFLPLTTLHRGTQTQTRNSSNTQTFDMFETLIRVLAPNGFIATRDNVIIRIIGDISDVTELNENSALLRLSTKILKSDLRPEAGSLITLCLRSQTARSGRWYNIKGPDFDQLRLTCYPLLMDGDGEDHVLFAIEKREAQPRNLASEEMTNQDRMMYMRQIEDEIASTREALQQTIEELQTSNEELQSVNEEMQATNEELQATNEELETSNEELQATNEELITVNEEMQINSTELQQLSIELAAILEATPYPTLVVDPALQIRHGSAAAIRYFGLSELPQSGTHVSACVDANGMPHLVPKVAECFRHRESETLEFDDGNGAKTLTFTPIFKGITQDIIGVIVTVL
ncbi:chemotaxis protein methyltransferase CheR/two-component system CheB/CheR fusion protein [Ruegeria sp. P4]|nr:chemotaxis protein methyltransferase CheR/two-component system CheB/CheR fusion protein [Ruegeria sp. P4]